MWFDDEVKNNSLPEIRNYVSILRKNYTCEGDFLYISKNLTFKIYDDIELSDCNINMIFFEIIAKQAKKKVTGLYNLPGFFYFIFGNIIDYNWTRQKINEK